MSTIQSLESLEDLDLSEAVCECNDCSEPVEFAVFGTRNCTCSPNSFSVTVCMLHEHWCRDGRIECTYCQTLVTFVRSIRI